MNSEVFGRTFNSSAVYRW